MRNSTWLLATVLFLATLATIASASTPNGKTAPKASPSALRCCKNVRLNGEGDFAKLAAANPRHYAIARRIVNAAGEICKATAPATTYLAKFDAQQIACRQALWLTSYPPKRELFFKIEDTFYSALVTVRDTGARLEPID